MPDVRHRSLLIVGAGPHGLTLALRAVEAGFEPGVDLEIIDPSGEWCAGWRERFAAHEIEALRSPGVHHPGADSGGLYAFADELGLRSDAAYGQPRTEAFNGYCAHLAREAGLNGRVTPTRAHLLAAGPRSVTVLCDDDVVFEADRAVLATNPGRRRIPGWVRDLLPLPSTVLAHAGDVDLRPLDLTGQVVTIVGGGLSAAQLAVGARTRGAEQVHLVIRRRLRTSAFDVSPGWLGPRYLDDFERLPPAERAETILSARDGGSLPDTALAALRRMEDLGHLVIHEHARVVTGARSDRGDATIVLDDASCVRSDRIWLATGTTCTVDTCRLLDDVVGCHPCDQHLGLPDLAHDLSWPGTALHLSGRLAGLQLGPAAGNIWGAGRAADRIMPAVVGAQEATLRTVDG